MATEGTSRVSKPSRSPVWDYFDINATQQRACCRLCAKALVYKAAGGTTSNLLKHMSTYHSLVWDKKKEAASASGSKSRQAGPLDCFVKRTTCPAGRAGMLTDAIVDMVALDLRPVGIVDGRGFRRLMSVAEPAYRVPSRTHISSLLKRKHQDGLSKLKTVLAPTVGVSLTTDMWTSRAMEGYITATAHFIDESWTQRSLVLATAGFVAHHTAENISKTLLEISEDMQLTGKVVALTHDEAANQCAAVREACRGALQKTPTSSWKSVVCAAHRLQTCLRYGLQEDEIVKLISDARKLVGHFRHSAKATHALMERQVQPQPKKVIQDVVTRWNSTFYMLERLLELRTAISAVLSDKKISKLADLDLDLTSRQWRLADSLLKLLRPFESATRLVSAEQNVSLSVVIPIMEGLQKGLSSADDDCEAITSVKGILTEQITTRFKLDNLDADALPVMASLLDARFKKAKFFPDEEDKQASHSALLSLMKAETARQEAVPTPPPPADVSDKEKDSLKEPPAKKPRTQTWDIVGIDFDDADQTSQKSTESEEEELRRYLDSEPLARNKNPLDWWRLKADSYPRLALLARRILCVQATSTPSERVFSAGGLIVNQQRATLSPANVDAIVFLNKNREYLCTPLVVPSRLHINTEPQETTPPPVETSEEPRTSGEWPELSNIHEWEEL